MPGRVIDAEPPHDPERVERARDEVIGFFRGLEESLIRLEKKVDFQTRMIHTLGERLLGRQSPQGGPIGLVPIDPAILKNAGKAWKKVVEAFRVLTRPT